MAETSWLLFLYSLPAKKGAARLSLWRQLKRLGAVSLKTSAYVLPDRPELLESFQWLGQRVREQGGEVTLVRAADVDGVSDDELVDLFQRARTADYEDLIKTLRALLPAKGKKPSAKAEEVEKIMAQFQAVRRTDFFGCPKAGDVEVLIGRLKDGKAAGSVKRLSKMDYQGRIWLTRPRPEVDRVGSAWLIQRFIDPKASFVFAANAHAHPEALPYDMLEVEFGHHGDDCTFETLIKRFALESPGLVKIAAIIHDADLADGRFGTHEGHGLLAVFRGWAQLGWEDEDILTHGFDCFDALFSLHSSHQFKPDKKR